jgi:D-3-phosphoglycerate dehydrogenase
MLKAALGMRILVSTPRANPAPDGELVATLAEGLAEADLVSLHAPMGKEAHRLIGEAALAAIKPGAILVNTARAGLVDETALARALANGRIAAAGLDVFSHGAAQGPLAATGRVIFTPHLGGATVEALKRTAVGSARNVVAALAGRTPATALNAPVGAYAAL